MSRGSGKGMLARVQLDPSLRSSLVHLPVALHAPLIERNVAPQSIVVELTVQNADGSDGAKYYCGWSGRSAAPLSASDAIAQSSTSQHSASGVSSASVISISPALANSFQPVLRTKDANEIVRITLLRSPPLPIATRVDVSPLDADDWEILGSYAEDVELNLLEQCRAACQGMILVVFVGKGGRTTCRFRVESTEPPTKSVLPGAADENASGSRSVRLSTDTELVIAPKVRASHLPVEEKPEELDMASQKTSARAAAKSVEEAAEQGVSAAEARAILRKTLYRVLPARYGPRQPPMVNGSIANGSAGGRSRSHSAKWANQLALLDSPTYSLMSTAFSNMRCSITKVPCPTGSIPERAGGGRQASSKGKSRDSSDDDDSGSDSDASEGDASESQSAEAPQKDKAAQGEEGSAPLPERPTAGAAFIDGEAHLIADDDAEWPRRHVWLGSGLRQALGVRDFDLVLFSAPSPATSRQIEQVDVPQPLRPHVNGDAREQPKQKRSLAGVDKILERCTSTVRNTMLSRVLFRPSVTQGSVAQPAGMLLTGGPGAGKTAVAREVLRRLSQPAGLSSLSPLLAAHYVDCTSHSEERVSALRDLFQSWLNAASWNAPSVLVLDNIDVLASAEQEHADGARNRQIAEGLVSRIQQTTAQSDVFVILTAQSTTSVHALLNTSHIFVETVQLKAPPKEARREILDFLVQKKLTPGMLEQDGLNYITLSGQTEGYLPADMRDLVERAVHEAAIRAATEDAKRSKADASGPLFITMDDFAKAQEGFTPLSLRDVKLEKSEVSWSDIGGLVETRRVLRETLEWPTKYAAIFASCPLRLRSGLLLYGYPGCGKTLLASAVAKECGLNFISVKGPEILNKYIGASEKSVRDLFDRAQAAKPCVLFFDEFDSIAPKRGHDSTGVTDRVVNQLLTQMDGAEGLDGVYVLAATSRPDLIDSALLRPGRLDKSLLCDMPSEEDRLDIMRAVANKIKLHPDVDLAAWAQRTEGFSGADLQALLYNAHLETIHESISDARLVDGGETSSKKASVASDLEFVQVGGPDAEKNRMMSGAQKQALTRRLELMLENTVGKRSVSGAAASPSAGASAAAASGDGAAGAAPSKRLVTDAHLERSLRSTRPSVPAEEQRRLRKIYAAFAGERDGKFPDGEASQKIGARESLM